MNIKVTTEDMTHLLSYIEEWKPNLIILKNIPDEIWKYCEFIILEFLEAIY